MDCTASHVNMCVRHTAEADRASLSHHHHGLGNKELTLRSDGCMMWTPRASKYIENNPRRGIPTADGFRRMEFRAGPAGGDRALLIGLKAARPVRPQSMSETQPSV